MYPGMLKTVHTFSYCLGSPRDPRCQGTAGYVWVGAPPEDRERVRDCPAPWREPGGGARIDAPFADGRTHRDATRRDAEAHAGGAGDRVGPALGPDASPAPLGIPCAARRVTT